MPPLIELKNLKSVEELTFDKALAEITERSKRLRSVSPTLAAATDAWLDGDGRLKIIKSMPGIHSKADAAVEASSIKSLAEARGLKWKDGMEKRVVAWWASDQRIDKHRDVVLQNWVLNDYRKNAVILFGHDWNMPPIGKSIAEEVLQRAGGDYTGPALRMNPLFSDDWDFATTVFRLIDSGFLTTGSVGLMPGRVITIRDVKERQALGIENDGLIFDKNELNEFSVATIPANPGAHIVTLRSMRDAKLLRAQDVQVIRDLSRQMIMRGSRSAQEWSAKDSLIRAMWKSLFPDAEIPKHDEIDVPLIWDAVKVKGREMGFFSAEEVAPIEEPKNDKKDEPTDAKAGGGDGKASESTDDAGGNAELAAVEERLMVRIKSLETTLDEIKTLVERSVSKELAPSGAGTVIESDVLKKLEGRIAELSTAVKDATTGTVKK